MTKDVFYSGDFTVISIERYDDTVNCDCSKCPEPAYFSVHAESTLGHHWWSLCDMCLNHCQ